METQAYIEDGEAIGLNEGEVHRLLAAERRRIALEFLGERGPTGLETLAEEVVRRERRGDVTESARRQVTLDLYHRHLPLMADLEVIEFDPRSKRVESCRIGAEVA